MSKIRYKNKIYNVDDDGFLNSLDQWDTDWIEYIMKQESIVLLTEDHWKVIKTLQDYHNRNGIAPIIRILTKITGFKLKYLYELFPSGPARGACKMAGLPKPLGCV